MVNFLFLPALLLIGAITAFEDFHLGKIRNKWIRLGLGWGLFCVLLLFILKITGHTEAVSLQYLERVLINFVLAVAAGFTLWKLKAWSAGDAKLFMVFALLIPLNFYWKSYLPLFPSFVLLVNIFCLVFLYVLGGAVIFYAAYVYKKIFKKSFADDGAVAFDLQRFAEKVQAGKINSPVAIFRNGLAVFLRPYNAIANKKEISVEELEPRMIPTSNSINKVLQEDIAAKSRQLGIIGTEGLTADQASLVKKWALEKNIKKIKILKTFPFAVWMFAGVVLTLFIKMSAINLVAAVFGGSY